MATSSFTKNFTLESPKAVASFANIISTPSTKGKIKKNLVSYESEKRGEQKLNKMLSR